jgi:hypothetical protein
MTGAGPPSLPGGRVLAQWWQELAPRGPQRLWFSRLLLHHVEALTEVACPCTPDPLQQALLRRLSYPSSALATALESLPVERSLLLRYLRELARHGWLDQGPAGWQLTSAGRDVAVGAASCRHRQRQGFHFLDNAAWQLPPHFLRLAHGRPHPAAPPADWSFDPGVLRRCLGQEEGWKRRHHFPAEVAALVEPAQAPGDWRAAVVDFPEQLDLALVEVRDRVLLGCGTEAPGWRLEGPALELREGWEEVFPDLLRGLGTDDWRAAWADWCRPLNLPADEVAACRCEQAGHRLRVRGPRRLVERFRGGPRGEALAREGWVLAGSGRSREAAAIELTEETAEP